MFMQFSKAMKKAGPVPESIGNESELDRNWYEVGSHMMAMCLAEWFDHGAFREGISGKCSGCQDSLQQGWSTILSLLWPVG